MSYAGRSASRLRHKAGALCTAAADYRLTKHFDVYAGMISSRVADGLASGYLKTSATGTMSGVRFSF